MRGVSILGEQLGHQARKGGGASSKNHPKDAFISRTATAGCKNSAHPWTRSTGDSTLLIQEYLLVQNTTVFKPISNYPLSWLSSILGVWVGSGSWFPLVFSDDVHWSVLEWRSDTSPHHYLPNYCQFMSKKRPKDAGNSTLCLLQNTPVFQPISNYCQSMFSLPVQTIFTSITDTRFFLLAIHFFGPGTNVA